MRLFVVAVVLLVAAVVHAEPVSPGSIRVVDGDTIEAMSRTIRLVGFDTPEAGLRARCESERTLSARATFRLRQLIAGGGLDLALVPCQCRPGTEGTQACNYGRACGVLRVRGRDAGEILISETLARPYICERGRCPRRQGWCE